MDDLSREQYLTKRLPKVRTDRGPTAEWMAYLEELHSRVAEFPQPELAFEDEGSQECRQEGSRWTA